MAGAGSTSSSRWRGSPRSALLNDLAGLRDERRRHGRVDDHAGSRPHRTNGGVDAAELAEERSVHRNARDARGDRDVVALQAARRGATDPSLEDVIQRELGGGGEAKTASRVTGNLAHARVGTTPPLLRLARQRERACPAGKVGGHAAGQLGHQRRRDVTGIGEVRAGDRTVQRDVVSERGRRLVGDGHAADVHEQRGVERVTHLVVVEPDGACQRGRDEARAHRHARRQPEPEVGDHRQAAEKVCESDPLRHGPTLRGPIATGSRRASRAMGAGCAVGRYTVSI